MPTTKTGKTIAVGQVFHQPRNLWIEITAINGEYYTAETWKLETDPFWKAVNGAEPTPRKKVTGQLIDNFADYVDRGYFKRMR